MNKLLDGKIILITGGARGIGKAITKKISSSGAFVIINYYQSKEKAQLLLNEIKSKGNNGIISGFDVSNEEEVNKNIKALIKEFGKIDGLVNNAGITYNGLLPLTKYENWEKIIKINLGGVYLCSKTVLRSMLKTGGSIVNISSVVGDTGNAGQTIYSATKSGINGFTKSLAKEVASRGVRVNSVSPGYIKTDMTENLDEESKNKIFNEIPLKRFGEPEEVANTVMFLLSDLSNYITGETIKVNGGLYM